MHTQPPPQRSWAPREALWLSYALSSAVVITCALYASAGAGILAVLFHLRGDAQDAGLVARLAIKCTLFAALAGYAVWRACFHRLLMPPPLATDAPAPPRSTPATRGAMLAVLLLTVALAVPRLESYPRAEPDETHHLVVARNLAAYGVYGSGHPSSGFTRFDAYDSVGPPVILPVAGAIVAGGARLTPARLVMAAYALALALAVYVACAPVFGAPAAVWSAFGVTAALGSTYLSRSLYGEIPALTFVLAGFAVWRRSHEAQASPIRSAALAFGAGALVGLAVLCKSFMLNLIWPGLALLLFDRLGPRKLAWRPVAWAVAGTGAVLGAWWAAQRLGRAGEPDVALDVLSVYQHNLMFGLHSVPTTLGWILAQPLTLVGALAGLAVALPLVFHRRYDPPLAVLSLFLAFVVFWWLFFTTGAHPRYFWYASALAGLFAGPLAARLVAGVRGGAKRAHRIGALVALALLLLPGAGRLHLQAKRVYGADEMADERALVAYVRNLPDSSEIAVAGWPLERTLNFLAGRLVHKIKEVDEAQGAYDVVIVDPAVAPGAEGAAPTRTIGRFEVFERCTPGKESP